MLSIATVKVEARNGYVLVKVSLENRSASIVGPGTVLGRQTLTGGAVRFVEFPNSTSIPPGCTAKVSQLLSAMSELEFTGYRESNGGIIPVSGGMVKRLSFLRSLAEVTWPSIHTELGRWRDEVLVPRIRSIGAGFKALHENAWLRIAEAKQKRQHRAQSERQAWESVAPEIIRWWDEVLLPRTRLIAGRFKALHEKAWLRRAKAKQERHRAQSERQAWESVDAQIIRWWDEVLLPRTRLIAARFKALHEKAWLRRAEAKHERQHRDQLERQAWESFDAQIMRWWDEVLLPRIRFYRRPH